MIKKFTMLSSDIRKEYKIEKKDNLIILYDSDGRLHATFDDKDDIYKKLNCFFDELDKEEFYGIELVKN